MPRSSASLLREFNSIPRVIEGSAAGKATSGSYSNGQVISNPFAGGRGGNGNQREDINLQLARSLLADPRQTQEAKQNLANIVASQDADERRRQQAAVDLQYRKLVEAAADPRNPLSTQELAQGFSQLQLSSYASILPNPISFRKVEEETDNPQLDLTNTASAFSERFGVSQDYASSLLGLDPKSKKLTPEHKLKVAEFLANQSTASPTQQRAVSNSLRRVDKDISELKKNTVLFDNDGNVKPPPQASLFSNEDEAKTEYNEALAKLDELTREREDLVGLQRSFSSLDEPTSSSPGGDPLSQAEASAAATSGQPSGVTPSSEPAFKFTADKPLVLKPGDDVVSIYGELQHQASALNHSFFIFDPASGKTLEIAPNEPR